MFIPKNNMQKIIFVLLLLVNACEKKSNIQKSNCVSNFNGPCERIPINDRWLKTANM